jgi:serine/threonine protein kinase
VLYVIVAVWYATCAMTAKRKGSDSLTPVSYGQLNKHNPYVGYFIYSPSPVPPNNSHHPSSLAPSLSGIKNHVMSCPQNIVPFYEINHRKYIQQHPYTGSFHYAPGIYSKLHQLDKYRPQRNEHKDENKEESDNKNVKMKFTSNPITKSVDDSEIDFHRKRNLKYFIPNRKSAKRPNEEIKMSLTLKEWGSLPQVPQAGPPLRQDLSQHSANDFDESTWQVQRASGIQSYHLISETSTDHSQPMSEKYILFSNHLLGEGSYARIYLGKQVGTSLYVAIKVIPLSSDNFTKSSLHELPELIENEIQIQSRIWHRHVVNINDVYKSGKYLYLVMDYCSGGSLEQMLALRNRLSEDEARMIIYQLLDGLCCLHQHGVLHGDIKPGNIMFQPQSNVLHSQSTHDHLHHPQHQMTPIDLLYEKKLREGKLMISINTSPVVDLIEEVDEGGKQIDLLILEEMKTAVLHTRFVKRHEIKAIPIQSNPSKTSEIVPDPTRELPSVSDKIFDQREPQPPPPTRRRSASESWSTNFFPKEEFASSNLKSKGCSGNYLDIEEEMESHRHIRYKSPYGLLLKLCDFGLSQSVPNIKFYQITGSISKAPYTNPCGTQGYLSPEIIEQNSYGLPADLWAVGIILYKSLSGNFPFIPFDSYKQREVSFNGIVWKKVSLECKELIRFLLTVNENDRITALQALHHHWFREILLISKIIVPSDEISIALAHTKEGSYEVS